MPQKEPPFCGSSGRRSSVRPNFGLAEGVGFEPTLAIKTRTVFKTVSINRSDTPPQRKEMIAQAVPVVTVGGERIWK
jgi:hypothetical protein